MSRILIEVIIGVIGVYFIGKPYAAIIILRWVTRLVDNHFKKVKERSI